MQVFVVVSKVGADHFFQVHYERPEANGTYTLFTMEETVPDDPREVMPALKEKVEEEARKRSIEHVHGLY